MTQNWLPKFNYYKRYMLVPTVGVVETTPMDRALGRSVKLLSDKARSGLTRKQEAFSNMDVFRDLLADTFYGYYLNDPEMKDSDDLPPEYRISQLLLTWMASQPDSTMAKSMTTGSAPASIAAALFSWRAMLSDEAFEAIRRALENLQNMKRDIESKVRQEREEERRQPQSQNEQSEQEQPEPQSEDGDSDNQDDGSGESEEEEEQEQGGDGGSGDGEEEEGQGSGGGGGEGEGEQEQPPQASSGQKTSEQMQEEYERKAEKVEKAIKNMMGNPITNGAMREAAKQSLNKIEDLSAMAKSWGLELGEMSVIDVANVMDLYEMNKDFVTQLANLIGRAEIASSSALQRVRESYIGNPTKINLTQDLSKVLPFESILLSEKSPHLIRTQQVLDWATQGLLGWVVEAEGLTQGSFVAYVDGSGSMRREKIAAAKAIAFGLAKVLHEDRFEQRAYVIKTFGTREDGFIEIDETSDLSKVAEWAGLMPGGGTEFDQCFEDCLEEMKKLEERDILGSDLVFITDGQADVSDENKEAWTEFQERTGSRMMLVLIQTRGRTFMREYIEELKEMADLVVIVYPDEFSKEPEKVIDQLVDVIAMPRKEKNGL